LNNMIGKSFIVKHPRPFLLTHRTQEATQFRSMPLWTLITPVIKSLDDPIQQF
jgi:hypothetical protein